MICSAGSRSTGAPRSPARLSLTRRLSGRALGIGVHENLRAVLIAHIAELTMRNERINVAPEMIEQLIVGHDFRIEHDLDGLDVSCPTA